MHETVDDFDDMEEHGHGFSSADSLEKKIDIGEGSILRPAFINAITWKPIRKAPSQVCRSICTI